MAAVLSEAFLEDALCLLQRAHEARQCVASRTGDHLLQVGPDDPQETDLTRGHGATERCVCLSLSSTQKTQPKNPRVRKISVRNSGAGNGCANFMGCVCLSLSSTQKTQPKNPRVRKISVRNSGAGNGCANFMDTWKKCVVSAGKPMSIKFRVLGGGVLGGGGKGRFYFYGHEDFLPKDPAVLKTLRQ